jgi:hypothetical protein
LLLPGGALVAGEPWTCRTLNFGHPGRAGHGLLTAHRLQPERLVIDVQVVRHRVAAVGVHEGDGLAAAVEPAA